MWAIEADELRSWPADEAGGGSRGGGRSDNDSLSLPGFVFILLSITTHSHVHSFNGILSLKIVWCVRTKVKERTVC